MRPLRSCGGLMLVLLAVFVSGGCLPSEEDTLGTPPGNIVLFINFDAAGLPGFVPTGSDTNWIPDAGNGGSSGPPSMKSPPLAGTNNACNNYTLNTESDRITFQRRLSGSSAGATYEFQIDLVAQETVLMPANTGFQTVSFSYGLGAHTFSWCLTSTGTGPYEIWVDDITAYAD